jgi:ferrous iron transport protein A
VKAFPKIVTLFHITKPNFIFFQRGEQIVFTVSALKGANLLKMKRLSELEPGTIARIHSFEKNDLFLKLMEMGCVPGELIKVEQIAPLGDPISITVAGYNLSLRLDEADNIFMEEGVR